MAKKGSVYEINYMEKRISITKKFQAKAGVLGSEEYNILRQLLQDYPNFEVKVDTYESTGVRHSGFTIKFMRSFIMEQPDGNIVIEEFEQEYKQYKDLGSKGLYGKLKKWFLKKYPQFTSMEVKIERQKAKLDNQKRMIESEIELNKTKTEINNMNTKIDNKSEE